MTLVQKWLKTEYPKIKKMAQIQGADIYFGDAAHIRSDHHAGRTWGKKGETPTSSDRSEARHQSDLGDYFERSYAVYDQGKRRRECECLYRVLKRLMIGAKRPVFLIVDRGPAHRAKKTKAFVETLGGQLILFFYRPIRLIATPTNWCGNI